MKPRLKTSFALISALLGLLALAASPVLAVQSFEPVYGDPLRESWRWRSFADLSGLEAECVFEGPDRTLWFGTADGLSSYDGFEWKRHLADGGVLGGWVSGIASQPDGTLTVGGWWGISQLRDSKWTRLLPAVGVKFADVRTLATGLDGSVWAATSWGALHQQQSNSILYTDPGTAARLQKDPRYQFLKLELLPPAVLAKARNNSLPTNRIDLTEIRADQSGRIWFGTKSGEVLCCSPVSANSATADVSNPAWSIYNESDGLAGGRTPSILPLQDGAVWVVAGSASNVSVFDGKTWRTLPLPDPGAGPDGAKLLQTRDGVVWVSARYVLFAWRQGQWRTYQKPEVPLPSARNLLLQSADGALWLVGQNIEIQRVDYQTPSWLTLRDLNFQCESPTGAQWFLHRSGRVVAHDSTNWLSYGVEDGLMDAPVALLGTRSGEVWAAGSHNHVASTARFDGRSWARNIHADFAWTVDWRAAFESSDGSVWFGAGVDSSGPKEHYDGILQFHHGIWTHHHQPGRCPQDGAPENPATILPPNHRPEPIEKYYALGESRDGRIWAGRNVLVSWDKSKWTEFFPSADIHLGAVECILSSRDGDLWLGTRQYGALRYNGTNWQQFQGKDSLVANSVRSLAQTSDGSIWAATDRDLSRFDGFTWTIDGLSDQLNLPYEGSCLKASSCGELWINRFTPEWTRRAWPKAPHLDTNAEFWTVCHQLKGSPPRTFITAGAKKVSRHGNVSVFWSGATPWRAPKDARLEFSFRLDQQPWSAFSPEEGHVFFTLPSGRHHLEARARDQDFNIDPHPAILDFVVLPPVWRQPWFIALMAVMTGLVLAQSFRVLLEQGRLRKAHAELEERVRQRTAQLEAANKELESFSYSVSHDLRAPLRSIDGFSRALLEDYYEKLDADGKEHLQTIRGASQRMGHLIDDILRLSKLNRSEMRHEEVDLSLLVEQIADEIKRSDPARNAQFVIAPRCFAWGDAALLKIALENIVGNAWKYSSKKPVTKIEFGVTQTADGNAFFVRDHGCGFDMKYVNKLFGAFQRLHSPSEFPGTGIGLSSVQRVMQRHGGCVWIEGRVDEGATLYFTLPEHRTTF